MDVISIQILLQRLTIYRGQDDYNHGVKDILLHAITAVSLQTFIHRENGRRFLTPLVCAGCLLTGRQFARVSPEEVGFVRPEQRLPFTL